MLEVGVTLICKAYDIKENKLYYNESKEKQNLNLKIINFFELFDDSYLKLYQSVIKKEAKIPQKLYINNVKDTDYISDIKREFKSKFSLDIIPELIAKFNSDISLFEQEHDDNLIFYYILKEKKKAFIYYHYCKIYENSIITNDATIKVKKQVLVYKINKSKKLLKYDFSKSNKELLNISPKNKEANISYLIANKNEELYYEEQRGNYIDDNKDDSEENATSEGESEIYSLNGCYDIKKENLIGKATEFSIDHHMENDLRGDNIEKSYSDKLNDSFIIDDLIEEHIFDEENLEEDDFPKVNLDSLDFRPIRISKNIYDLLKNGNQKALDDLLEKINNKRNMIFKGINNILIPNGCAHFPIS